MAELGFHLPSLIVFVANFSILLAVLYAFGYKRILAMLDQRSDRIRESLEEGELRESLVNILHVLDIIGKINTVTNPD